jgi:acyl-CoA synthetase (AMP-forming)/AMP-acid ligase II
MGETVDDPAPFEEPVYGSAGRSIVPVAMPEHLRRAWARSGLTSSAIPAEILARNAKDYASLPAVIDGDVELTWAELITEARRFASYLMAVGVGRGQVVAWQLPTWWEAIVVHYGTWFAGAISNPIVSIYRLRELTHILSEVQASCVVTAREFRGCDHVDLFAEAGRAAGVKALARVAVRGSAPGWTSFGDAVSGRGLSGPVALEPDEPALVLYTSGTESAPKGAIHTSRTCLASAMRSVRMRGLGWNDRVYVPGATLAHIGGLERAVLSPMMSGHRTIFRDRWDADQAVADLQQYEITLMSGSPVFVQELSAAAKQAGVDRLQLAKGFMCGGAALTMHHLQLAESLGLRPVRGYGLTENLGNFSVSQVCSPPEIRLESDGYVVAGGEVRVVDEAGKDLPAGTEGELLIRSPTLARGYISPAQTVASFDTDSGWFRTGDLGTVSSAGILKMTGRLKEIINRGGEKFSAREIEDLLLSHPAVADVAVVPAKHERLGEQPAAFVLINNDTVTSEQDLAEFLRRSGLAAQKIPTIWRWVSGEFERNVQGKIRKDMLERSLAQ